MPTREEILSATKAKYPQYKDIPDDELATALSAKYPAYAEDLNVLRGTVDANVDQIFIDPRSTQARINAGLTAPQLASARETQAQLQQLEGMLGGEMLTPEGESVLSPLDSLALRRADLNQQQAALEQEALGIEDLENTNPLVSAGAGAATLPLGMASLATALRDAGISAGVKGLNVLLPSGKGLNQIQLPQNLSAEPINTINDLNMQLAAVNPLSATAGAVLAGGPTMGRGKALSDAIRAGTYRDAAAMAAVGGGVNAGIGSGLRLATGQEVTPGTVAFDTLLGGLTAGRNQGLSQSLSRGIDQADAALLSAAQEGFQPIRVGISDMASAAGAIPRAIGNTPLARGVTRYAGATRNVVVDATKGAGSLFAPKSLVDDIVDASAIRTRFNPKRGIKDLENTRKAAAAAVKRPEFFQQAYDQGFSLEGAGEAKLFFGQFAKDVHVERRAVVGRDVPIDLNSSVASRIEEIVNDPVVRRQHPDLIPALEAEANKYRDVIGSIEAEELNKAFNAQVEVLRARLSPSEFAALKQANPMLRASAAASEGLKGALVDSLGGEHSELGKLYGAAKLLQEAAALQEVKQVAQELKPGGLERLNSTASIGTSLISPIAGASQFVAGKIIKEAYSPNRNYEILDSQVRSFLKRGPAPARPTGVIPGPPSQTFAQRQAALTSPLEEDLRAAVPAMKSAARPAAMNSETTAALRRLRESTVYKNATPAIRKQLEDATVRSFSR